ncbi:MAG TPA: hypothetical protein VKD72_03760 [Gemmataceae bacterium]|nr:hypothetical protein [Gemmataceae bacterium]
MQPNSEQPNVEGEGDRVVVKVSREHAGAFHAYLRRQGIETVLCLDPAEQEAHLELPAWADPAALCRDLEAFERSPRPR